MSAYYPLCPPGEWFTPPVSPQVSGVFTQLTLDWGQWWPAPTQCDIVAANTPRHKTVQPHILGRMGNIFS